MVSEKTSLTRFGSVHKIDYSDKALDKLRSAILMTECSEEHSFIGLNIYYSQASLCDENGSTSMLSTMHHTTHVCHVLNLVPRVSLAQKSGTHFFWLE